MSDGRNLLFHIKFKHVEIMEKVHQSPKGLLSCILVNRKVNITTINLELDVAWVFYHLNGLKLQHRISPKGNLNFKNLFDAVKKNRWKAHPTKRSPLKSLSIFFYCLCLRIKNDFPQSKRKLYLLYWLSSIDPDYWLEKKMMTSNINLNFCWNNKIEKFLSSKYF